MNLGGFRLCREYTPAHELSSKVRINCLEVACHQLRSTGYSKALYQNEESRRSGPLCGFRNSAGENNEQNPNREN